MVFCSGQRVAARRAINAVPIEESERRMFGPRPESEHGLDFPRR
jgi:uncharacterized protein